MSAIATKKVSIWMREPVIIINVIVAILETVIPVLVGFGVLQWTPQQTGAVMTFIVAIGAGLKSILTRRLVTPVVDPYDNNGNQLGPL